MRVPAFNRLLMALAGPFHRFRQARAERASPIRETIRFWVLFMLLSPFLELLMVQSYQNTIYKIAALNHHSTPEFALEVHYAIQLLSTSFAAFSQSAY
jgi:hypothetical protein